MAKHTPIPEEVQYIAYALDLGVNATEIMFYAGRLAYENGRTDKAYRYFCDFIDRCSGNKEDERYARDVVQSFYFSAALKRFVRLDIVGAFEAQHYGVMFSELGNKLVKTAMYTISASYEDSSSNDNDDEVRRILHRASRRQR